MNLGDSLPKLTGVDAYGNPFCDQDLEGVSALLFFFSKNSSPEGLFLCQAYGSAIGEFEELELQIIGINEEAVADNLVFAHRMHLPFPLLSDPHHSMRKACGVISSSTPLLPAALLFDWTGSLCWKEAPIVLKDHIDRLLYACEVHCGCKALRSWYEENNIGTGEPGQ